MTDLLPKEPETIDVSKVIEDIDRIPFDLSPDETRGKLVVTNHGEKGAGKTYAVFLVTTGRIGGFPAGKTVVISFDNKTKITKEQHFPNDDITVYDGKRYYREDPSLCTKSGVMTYKYIQKLLESYKSNQPDWIVFDGFTVMAMILEMAMRYKHGLQPSEGVANRNVWKDRGRFVQDLHNLASRITKYGIAYITYSEKNEIVEAGTTISRTDVPKYIDIVMQETDVVLHSTKAKGKDGNLFYLRVESTKYKNYLNIDGKPIPKCDTTLEEGRTFNITKMAEIPSKKIIKNSIVPEARTLESEPIKPPKIQDIVNNIKKEEKVVQPKPPIPEVLQTPKEPEKTQPQSQPQKKFEIPDLLSL